MSRNAVKDHHKRTAAERYDRDARMQAIADMTLHLLGLIALVLAVVAVVIDNNGRAIALGVIGMALIDAGRSGGVVTKALSR